MIDRKNLRRDKKQLELATKSAIGKKKTAIAYYNLGLFHDNNGREAVAIPNYIKALELGLDSKTKARTLAWLASSFNKIGKHHVALKKCRESMKVAKKSKLRKFLERLEKRIIRALIK